MDRSFDIRVKADREALADHLPFIDHTEFKVSRSEFLCALEDAADFLKKPVWLVYEYGSFRPFNAGQGNLVLGLIDIVLLGMQLSRLSGFRGFEMLMSGFFNPPQFEDTVFEVKVAHFCSILPAITDLQFSPEYVIRGHTKRPEFEVVTERGRICVECKRPHLFAQKAMRSLHGTASLFKTGMTECQWPSDLRLEVEIIGALRGNVSEFVGIILREAIKRGPHFDPLVVGPFSSYVVRRTGPFRLPSAPWHTDTMVVGNVATRLFNPEFTSLRVANYSLDSKFEKSTGLRVSEALKQLPESEKCMIFMGGVPLRIADPVCRKRFGDPAYDHILGFGIFRDEETTIISRETDQSLINAVFGRGV